MWPLRKRSRVWPGSGTEILSLCGEVSQLTKQFFFDRSLADHLLFSSITAQILAETHPSVRGSPFVALDPDTVGTFPVSPDPAGKRFNFPVFDCLFEVFWVQIRHFTRVHCGQTWLYLKRFRSCLNELIRSWSLTCGIPISILSLYSRFGFSGSSFSCSAWIQSWSDIPQWVPPSSCWSPASLLPWYPHPSWQHPVHHLYACRFLGERSVPSGRAVVGIVRWWGNEARFSKPLLEIHF